MISGGGSRGHAQVGSRSGESPGGLFQHLQHGNRDSNLDQHQFYNETTNQLFSENVLNQASLVEQRVRSITEHLSMLQDRIQQLQALVPLISQLSHFQNEGNVLAQQQVASAAVVSITSQLAMVAVDLLLQSGVNTGTQPNHSKEMHLSQLLQNAANPNFSQQNAPRHDLRAPHMSHWMEKLLGGSFAASEGVNAAITSGNGGIRFSGGGGNFPVLIDDVENSGQQSLSGAQQVGGNGSAGSMIHYPMSNMIGKDFGSILDGKDRKPSDVLGSSSREGDSGANEFISVELRGVNAGLEDLDNDSRVDDEGSDSDNISPGSFDLVEMDATEILAEHTHFCEICGKGFKRDANLRMHMRGHGDVYKTAAALARPDRGTQIPTSNASRRYSCPYVGCKRNKKHRKFQPLKTLLCVKNHYRRSHCPKVLNCQKCSTKKFSVVADLKTHEKHCGREKWLCSCGTTFSRKDKLVGHIGLFVGHAPAMPLHDMEGGVGSNLIVDHHQSPAEAFGLGSKSPMAFWE